MAPATVAGWIPWMLTGWRMQSPLLGASAVRWFGWALVGTGATTVVECFARFALEGLGTPAPLAPTERLVVSGLYRYVRNPMYVGVVAAIVGQAFLFGSIVLLEYAALVWLFFFAFVLLYEEPALRRRFGPGYEQYCENVRRWLPRTAPWRGQRTP
jgi:protein-S-isoprenylcysteine O-methyltransferase Ste14